PFSTNNSFGLIGLATFCLLGFLRETLGKELPRWQRALHAAGLTAALLQAMMPLFRSIFITVVIIFLVDLFRPIPRSRKVLRLAVLCSMALGAWIAVRSVPQVYEERVSSPDNVYVRIAQQRQNFQLFLDHPVLGVGLTNFHDVALRTVMPNASYQGVVALDSPHSNGGAVLAETGIAGFIPYSL